MKLGIGLLPPSTTGTGTSTSQNCLRLKPNNSSRTKRTRRKSSFEISLGNRNSLKQRRPIGYPRLWRTQGKMSTTSPIITSRAKRKLKMYYFCEYRWKIIRPLFLWNHSLKPDWRTTKKKEPLRYFPTTWTTWTKWNWIPWIRRQSDNSGRNIIDGMNYIYIFIVHDRKVQVYLSDEGLRIIETP